MVERTKAIFSGHHPPVIPERRKSGGKDVVQTFGSGNSLRALFRQSSGRFFCEHFGIRLCVQSPPWVALRGISFGIPWSDSTVVSVSDFLRYGPAVDGAHFVRFVYHMDSPTPTIFHIYLRTNGLVKNMHQNSRTNFSRTCRA